MSNEEIIKKLVKKEYVSGICCGVGNNKNFDKYYYGYTDNSQKYKIDDNSLMDLASCSKLFTLIVYLKWHETGKLNLHDEIGRYTDKFKNLKKVPIYKLLNFSVSLRTDKRIDSCLNKKEALEVLYNTKLLDVESTYSDIGSIIASELLNIIGKSSHTFKNEINKIIDKCKMYNTYLLSDNIDKSLLPSYDYEYKYINKTFKVNRTSIGKCQDKKTAFFLGHAGIFSTLKDLSKFARCIVNCKLFSYDTMLLLFDEKYCFQNNHQRLGLLCYLKDPRNDYYYSEVSKYMSSYSIGISGYTGTHISLDFDKKIFVIILSNRINKKITYCDSDNIFDDNKIRIDNKVYSISQQYVFKKDALRDSLILSLLVTSKL